MSDHHDDDPSQPQDQQHTPDEAPVRSQSAKRWSRWIVAGIAVVAIVVVVIVSSGGKSSVQPASAQGSTTARSTAAAQRINALLGGIPESGNALGAAAAPVTLQYFGDLECPTSREFTIGALPFLIRRWVRDGQLRIEYRSLETATREPAVFEVQQAAALAAGMQDKLWYYIEFFYHEQGRERSGYVTASYLQGLARQTPGLNLGLWGKDRHNPRLPASLSADAQTAAGEGFSSTPSFLIGRTGSGHPSKLLRFSTIDPSTFNVAIQRLLAQGAAQPRARVSVSATSGLGARVAAVDGSATSGLGARVAAVYRAPSLASPSGGGAAC
jgi:hypothetical protein